MKLAHELTQTERLANMRALYAIYTDRWLDNQEDDWRADLAEEVWEWLDVYATHCHEEGYNAFMDEAADNGITQEQLEQQVLVNSSAIARWFGTDPTPIDRC